MRRFLRLSMMLLGFLAFPLWGQSPLPAGPLTPETLTHFCATQTVPCEVPIRGRSTLALSGDWSLPASVHLRFAAGSALTVTGGVLDFAAGWVEAPIGESIFPDPERVRGLSVARPEWFGSSSPQAPMPATALALAYEATVPWGTIYLQARQYLSPFSDCPGTPLRWLSPRTLIGSGRPEPDDPEAPLHLQGGTVLLGGINGTGALRLAHLGIDAGPVAAAGVLHGCQPPAVFIEQPENHQFVSGDRLEDISVLTTGAKDMHSVMLAGHRDTLVRGLRLWTLGGTHGLVMKSEDSVVDGFYCRGALADCLIVKSDYATDFLGRAVHDRIAHVDIGPLKPGGYVGGIMVESRWDTVRDLEMSDVRQTGSFYSLILLGSLFYHPRDIVIRNWDVEEVSGACLLSDRAVHVTVSGFRCNLTPSARAGAVLLGGGDVAFENGVFRCLGEAAACALGKTDGVSADSLGHSLRDVTADGLGGYLVRSSKAAPDSRYTHMTRMDGRLYVRSPAPFRVRATSALTNLKPDLRILYTAAMVRLYYHPRRYGMEASVALLLVAGALAAIRRSRKQAAIQAR